MNPTSDKEKRAVNDLNVKSQMPKEAWLKRVESRIYRKKVRNFVRLLKTLRPLDNKLGNVKRKIAHYFLDVMEFEEVRRQSRPVAENIKDTTSSLKDSVKY